MAQTQITYTDKTNKVVIVDRTKQATAEDFNEIKAAVNDNANDVTAEVVKLTSADNDSITFYSNAGQVRAIAVAEIEYRHTVAVKGLSSIFLWNAASTASDDGYEVIRPTAIDSGDPGRYLVTSRMNFSDLTAVLGDVSGANSRIGDILIIKEAGTVTVGNFDDGNEVEIVLTRPALIQQIADTGNVSDWDIYYMSVDTTDLKWQFNTDTTNSDPGNGQWKIDSAEENLYINALAFNNTADFREVLDTLKKDSIIYIQDNLDFNKFYVIKLTADAAEEGTYYYKVPITIRDNGSDFAAGDIVGFTFLNAGGTDNDAIHDNVSGEINAIVDKPTPVDADVALIEDSAATNTKKKLSWANIKATLKTYFDTLYAAVLGADDNYVTDAEKTIIGNTSGTNTGDQDLSGKENVNVAQGIMDTHETTHPIPTTRDARSQVAGSYEPAKGADDNFVTDAQLVVVGNTSGTNTGDQQANNFNHNDLNGLNDGDDYEHVTAAEKAAIGTSTALTADVVITKATTDTFADVQADLDVLAKNMAGFEIIIRYADGTHNMGDDILDTTSFYNGRIRHEAVTMITVPGTNQNAEIYFNGSGYFKGDNNYLNNDFAGIYTRLSTTGTTVMFQYTGNSKITTTLMAYRMASANAKSSVFYAAGVDIASNGDTFDGNMTYDTNFVEFVRGVEAVQGGKVDIYNAHAGTNPFTNAANGVGSAIFGNSEGVFTNKVTGGAIDKSATGTADLVTVSAVSVTAEAATTGTFNGTSNRDGDIDWAALLASSNVPTKAEITAGTNALDYASVAATADTPLTDGITGLTASTNYKAYAYSTDEDGNASEVRSDAFTTTAADVTAPTITGFTDTLLNTSVDVNVDEGVYGANDGTTPVAASDLQITGFVAGGATALSIASITNTSGGALTGGESIIRIVLSWTGTPDGTETFAVQPIDSTSIYDAAANAMLSTETTGTITSDDEAVPVATFAPLNGSTTHPIADDITITYDEAIRNTDASEITDANVDSLITLKLTNSGGADVGFDATINAGKTIITINPTSDLTAEQLYYVAVASVEDAAGNENSASNITFTAADAAYETEYQAVYDEMTNVPSATNAGYQNAMVKSLKDGGYWTDMIGFYVLAQESNADGEAQLDWTAPTTANRALVENGAGSLTFTSNEGFTGDGTNNLATNTALSTLFSGYTVGTVAIYVRTNSVDSIYVVGSNGPASKTAMYLNWSDGTCGGKCFNNVALEGTPSTSVGFSIISRTSANQAYVYRNGSQIASNTVAATEEPTDAFYVFAATGAAAADFQASIAFVSKQGFNSTAAAAINTIIETYMDALGKGVQ